MKLHITKAARKLLKRNGIATALFGLLLLVFAYANHSLTLQNVVYVSGILIVYFIAMYMLDLFTHRKK